MRRTQMYLTDKQRSRLARLARAEGVSEAVIVRRILDKELGLSNGPDGRLAAVEETAGLLAGAPDWPDWLARVRGSGADDRLRELGL